MRGLNLSITADKPLTQDSWTFGLSHSIWVIFFLPLVDSCAYHIWKNYAGKLLQTSHQLSD